MFSHISNTHVMKFIMLELVQLANILNDFQRNTNAHILYMYNK